MWTRTVRATLLAAAVALAGVGLAASPAGAQEGDASITVDQAHPGPGSTHYFVSVTDASGAPVNDAEVTATPIGPDGEEGEPVTLQQSGEGIYQGAVPMTDPGEWTVRFESVDPPGTGETTQQVADDGTSTGDGSSNGSSAGTGSDDGADDTAAAAADDEDDDDSSVLALVLLLAGLAAVAVLAVVLFVRGGKDDTPASPDTEDGASTDAAAEATETAPAEDAAPPASS
ncbi:MAG TPA: FixH family protein [Acidimicrobiales bacterium]